MSLSLYLIHRIYMAANMNYGLGFYDLEELAHYNKIRKEMDDKKNQLKRGYPLIMISRKEGNKLNNILPKFKLNC